MRTIPLMVLVMLLLQTSWAFSEVETDCRATVERSAKNQTERLMNQFHLGQIGGLEFEKQRSVIFTLAAAEREVCEQKSSVENLLAPAGTDYNSSNAAVHATTLGRTPASVQIEEYEASEIDQ